MIFSYQYIYISVSLIVTDVTAIFFYAENVVLQSLQNKLKQICNIWIALKWFVRDIYLVFCNSLFKYHLKWIIC